jgi:sjoegren syndrome nuclear autoantigen 1
MNTVSPSTLQTFNNELVKGLEHLRDKYYHLSNHIDEQEGQKRDLEQQIAALQQKLQQIDRDLKQKQKLKLEYESLISDTETAYLKIVDSSQTLLDILQKQTNSLSLSKQR